MGLGSIGKVLGSVTDAVGLTNIEGQQNANATNIRLADANRDWMERMSNTAYQRAMGDMGKAGLNPILAYQQGGASVPNSSAATVETVGNHGLGKMALENFSGIKNAMSSAQSANTAQAQMESTKTLQSAQTAREVATTKESVAKTRTANAEAALKERELKGKGVKEVADRYGGKMLSSVLDSIEKALDNSAKSTQERKIKVLGTSDKPLINRSNKGPK